MNDYRGMIKWQPFNSVINGKSIINSLIKEKTKIKKPIISEEDTKILEEKIINAYYTNTKIKIIYYKDGNLVNAFGTIKKIDQVYKMIYLENKRLLFSQIVNIISQ